MAKRQNAKDDVKKKLVSRSRPVPFLSTPPFLFTIEKIFFKVWFCEEIFVQNLLYEVLLYSFISLVIHHTRCRDVCAFYRV